MKVIATKKLFPYLYEFQKLGESKTEEGRKYMEENQYLIDKEINVIVETGFYRTLNLGENREIHETN